MSAGKVLPVVDLRVLGEDGATLPCGEVGEICVRGDTVMQGYWRNPDATEAAIRDGWFHTGDLGRVDEYGFLYLLDRLKEMIKTGGENVFSLEVEAALMKHPAILEAAVFAMPSEKWGEEVHAAIRLRPGQSLTAAQAIDHCRRELAAYKCPKVLTILEEGLPRSAAGKVLKGELRSRLAQPAA